MNTLDDILKRRSTSRSRVRRSSILMALVKLKTGCVTILCGCIPNIFPSTVNVNSPRLVSERLRKQAILLLNNIDVKTETATKYSEMNKTFYTYSYKQLSPIREEIL